MTVRAAKSATLVMIALAGGVLAGPGAPVALASPPSVTLTGAATDGFSPDSDKHRVTGVRATLSQGLASGYLETEGKAGDLGGPWDGFQGTVTCMSVQGDHIVVGAVGTAWHLEEGEAQRVQQPGSYVQLLSVDFADYLVFEPPEPPVPAAFSMLGEDDQGVPGAGPPDCSTGVFEKFWPATNGALHISPSITSPADGSVNETGVVTLAGTAERNSVLAVYDVADVAHGALVTADSEGNWSATIAGLKPGVHVFSAFVRPGSDIPSNTVQVEVLAPKTPPANNGDTQSTPTPSPVRQGVLASQEIHAIAPIPYARLASTSIGVSHNGALTVAVSCPTGETSCAGTVTLRTLGAFSAATGGVAAGPTGHASTLRLAVASFSVAGGHVRSVTLRLSSRGRALLTRHRKLPARATIVAHDPAGAVHTTQATVMLRASTRRR